MIISLFIQHCIVDVEKWVGGGGSSRRRDIAYRITYVTLRRNFNRDDDNFLERLQTEIAFSLGNWKTTSSFSAVTIEINGIAITHRI